MMLTTRDAVRLMLGVPCACISGGRGRQVLCILVQAEKWLMQDDESHRIPIAWEKSGN